MKKKMIIKNFVTLQDIEYYPNWINIIIGDQTSGKSLIVKLDYFFNEIFLEELFFSILHLQLKNYFLKSLKERFFKYFNKNIIFSKPFEIYYFFSDELYIKIYTNKSSLKIEISERFTKLRNELKKELKKISEGEIQKKFTIIKSKLEKIFNMDNIFIPAGRSFFANINNNVFTILADDGKIDPFLIEFGKELETLKFFLPKNKEIKLGLLENILKAKIFLNEKSEFFLKMHNKEFNIMFASSGQQELLPLGLILNYKKNTNLFIEEPEAHLFPTSQKQLIELIIKQTIINNMKSLTITTHSPYILTAFNNLILAHEANIPKNSNLKYLKDISLPIEKIAAYSIENGKLHNIINKEENLIEGYTIDKVSEEFSQIFDELLDYID